jgi:hypothetical protein
LTGEILEYKENKMKKDIKIATHSQTIQALTLKMLSKERYAYVNFPRSALIAMGNSDSKKTSKNFNESIIKSFNINHQNYMKGIPLAFLNSNDSENELDYSKIDNNQIYYNSTTLENYFNNNEIAFSSFVDFYIRNTPYVIVTFHDRKVISRVLGAPYDIIYVPYNDYYDKLDSIIETLSTYKGKVDTVILDCPLLSAALAERIWNKLDFSIIDFGKVISFARARFNTRTTQNEKAD